MLAHPIGHNNPDAEDASHFLSIIASTARTPRLTRTGECEKESNEKRGSKGALWGDIGGFLAPPLLGGRTYPPIQAYRSGTGELHQPE